MLHWAGSSGSCSRLRGLGVLPARVIRAPARNSKIKLTVGKIVPRNRIALYFTFYPETTPGRVTTLLKDSLARISNEDRDPGSTAPILD